MAPTYLFFGVAELGEVVDAVQHSTFVRNASVEVMLLAVLVDAQSLEHQPLGESWLEWTDLEDGIHVKLCWAHGGQVLLHSTPDDRAPEMRPS